QEARRLIGHGERVAIAPVAELELTFEVGTPEVIGGGAGRQRRALRAALALTRALDQAVAIEHGMDGALGRNPNIAVKSSNQELAVLAGSPMWLPGLQLHDQAFELLRQLVGVAHRPPRPVRQGLEPVRLVAIKNLVAGLPRDAEIPADVRHGIAVQQPDDKPK